MVKRILGEGKMMKRYIADIIICGIFFLLVLLLASCAKQEPLSETIADTAVNTVTAIEQSLPVECKTDAITTQFIIAKTEIRNVKNACENEKKEITRDKRKWQFGFWALVLVIGAYITRKILK